MFLLSQGSSSPNGQLQCEIGWEVYKHPNVNFKNLNEVQQSKELMSCLYTKAVKKKKSLQIKDIIGPWGVLFPWQQEGNSPLHNYVVKVSWEELGVNDGFLPHDRDPLR